MRPIICGVPGGEYRRPLSLLERLGRAASISDRPPVATSGEAALTFLSQDTLKSVYRLVNAENQYDPQAGQLTGLTPFSYAAGSITVSSDPHVSANLFVGHFGSEVGLILDAAERNDSLTLGGSDDLQAQAVMYAGTLEPLIGEELIASGAYLQVNPFHTASIRAQDVMRWILVAGIFVGVVQSIGIHTKSNPSVYLMVAVAVISGILVLTGYFFPIMVGPRERLLDWAVILAAVLLLMGVISLVSNHWQKTVEGPKAGSNSLVLIISFIFTLVVTAASGPYSNWSMWLYENVLIPTNMGEKART